MDLLGWSEDVETGGSWVISGLLRWPDWLCVVIELWRDFRFRAYCSSYWWRIAPRGRTGGGRAGGLPEW